ncbi:MAG: spore germination GerPC family protein [Paenibacillaceae bacterium]|jgi:spore germination protein PC|nr:spore germination GerPC family protein [Paenibacillaceae bacterium]
MDPVLLWHLQEILRRLGWMAQKQIQTDERLTGLENAVSELSSQLKAVEHELARIAPTLDALESSVSALEDQPSTRIDKIEYRFEQLKVDTLSGSLHIGLAHGAEGLIEDLQAANADAKDIQLSGPAISGPASPDQAYTQAMASMQEYLRRDLPSDIDEAADAAGLPLVPELRQQITEDLSRQAEQRFMLYIKEHPFAENAGAQDAAPVIGKVRQDVREGLKAFFAGYGKESSA